MRRGTWVLEMDDLTTLYLRRDEEGNVLVVRMDLPREGYAVVYTPAVTLWAFLSQMLFTGAQRSCVAAVARVSVLWASLGQKVCDSNTGAYCRASSPR